MAKQPGSMLHILGHILQFTDFPRANYAMPCIGTAQCVQHKVVTNSQINAIGIKLGLLNVNLMPT